MSLSNAKGRFAGSEGVTEMMLMGRVLVPARKTPLRSAIPGTRFANGW